MVRVFIALALAVIIMLAPIFSGEYEGVDNIILTSKYGKTKCATAKVVAGILTAILTTALIVAFNLFLARAFYGTEGLNCSILFAPSEYVEAFIPFNITCGTLLKYQILLAFTCTISVTGITLLMSAISKNQIVALVAAMAIFLFPVLLPIPETNPLFRLVGLLPVYHVLAVSLMKGDIETMKKEVANTTLNKSPQDAVQLIQSGLVMIIGLLIAVTGLIITLNGGSTLWGYGLMIIGAALACFFAFYADYLKRKNKIQTYKELSDFYDYSMKLLNQDNH